MSNPKNSEKKEDIEEYESVGFFPQAEVLIFPNRLLAEHHVEEFLEKIKTVEGISKIMLTGPRIYETSSIKLGAKTIPLKIQVGKVIIQIEAIDLIKDIREVCDNCFKFGYRIGVGRYTKWRETTMDSVRGYSLVIRKDMLE
ncbi:MAG: methyl-coenzyme M reductase operon protein D [Candidatus Hodarchaeota archaeon]